QMPENSPHNTENKHQRIHHSAESVKRQMPENSPHNAEGVKNKHQRIYHSAQKQMLENSPHNTEDIQEHQRIHHSAKNKCRTPENSSQCQGQMPENSPYNSEVFKNTREFITVPEDKLQRIYHTMPKVFKNTREFITVPKDKRWRKFTTQCQRCSRTPEQMSENSLYDAEGVQEQTPENSSQCQKCPRTNIREFTTTLKNLSHNTEGIQEQTPKNSLKYQNAESAQGQMPENLPHNAESFKNKHQRIHYAKDAQEQIPSITPKCSRTNTPHNAENAQEQAPKNLLHNAGDKHQRKRTHYTTLKVFKKNSPHTAESARKHVPENLPLENSLHNAKCAQGQAPESSHTMPNMPKNKIRRFTMPKTNTKDSYAEKMLEDKHQKIYNAKLRIHLTLPGEHRDTLYNIKSF
ncbi:3774_t:CDS:2, partial [Dentiscutata heterogama]